jgi:hypothetical protein
MFRRIWHTQFWWVALGALPFSLCQGCIVATPMRAPTHNIGPSGEGANGKLALGFIQAGKTGREEVTQKLGWTDTGLKDDRLFLGRWASSSWGVYSAVVVAGGGADGAAGGGTDAWNRHWGTHNLLIDFDEKGLVKQYRVFPDSELVEELAAWVAESPNRSLDLSKPMEIPVLLHGAKDRHFNGTLVLDNDSFEFREDESSGVHNFKIAPKQIRTLSLARPADAHPRYMNGTIQFTEKTPVGHEVTIRVDMPTVMVLVKYLAQTRKN